jgi:hypothetical protein
MAGLRAPRLGAGPGTFAPEGLMVISLPIQTVKSVPKVKAGETSYLVKRLTLCCLVSCYVR